MERAAIEAVGGEHHWLSPLLPPVSVEGGGDDEVSKMEALSCFSLEGRIGVEEGDEEEGTEDGGGFWIFFLSLFDRINRFFFFLYLLSLFQRQE